MIKRTLLGVILTAVALLGLPGIANAQAINPDICGPKQTYFIFQYNFGVGGDVIDEGCADKNDVSGPNLIARELHVSCSDKFPGGVPEKSDLGDPARRVVAYFISKDGGKKTCGTGTPIPAGGIVGLLLVTGAVGTLGVTQLRKRRQVEL